MVRKSKRRQILHIRGKKVIMHAIEKIVSY